MTNTSKIHNNTGDDLVFDDGSTITFAGTTYSASEFKAAVALIANLPTSDQGDGVTVWNSNGVLKVSTGGA